MNAVKKSLALLVALLLCVGILAIPTYAAEVSQDGLEVTLTTDKDAYEQGETIVATLTVTNTGDADVVNVSLENLIPEGYAPAEGNETVMQVETLDAGETVTLTVSFVAEEPTEGETEAPTTGETEAPTEGTTEAPTEKPTTGDKPSKGDSPDTGDDADLGLWVMLMVVAVVGLAVLAVKSKLWKQMLSLVLCMAMLASMFVGVPVRANAEEVDVKIISIASTVQVGGEDVELQATVSYQLAEPERYTVTFESNGGSEVEQQIVEEGMNAVEPEAPVKEGYTFVGWYADATLTRAYDFSAPIAADLTLYAAWGITRGEWIELLVTECGYPHTVEGELATFADVSESEYRTVIETAVVYGFLDAAPETDFEPDSLTTREFAAETAVRCLGYFLVGEIECVDAAEIANPVTAGLAVELGMLELEDGYFYPARVLVQTEVEQILKAMELDFASAGIDTGEHDGFVFLEHIVVKDEEFTWESEGDTATLPEGETVPEVGQILVFGTEKVIKVEAVEVIDGETKITYSTPDLYEFLDYIDVQGTAQMDFANFIPAEGVTILSNSAVDEINQSVTAAQSLNGGAIQTMGFMDDWFDVDEEEIEINDPVSLTAKAKVTDNVDVVVDLDVNIPSVGYKFDIDFDFNPFSSEPLANVKNAYVKISEDVKVHVEVVAHTNGEDDPLINDLVYPPYIEIGSIPLIGVDGVGIVLEIDVVMNAEGKFELDYRVHGTLGAQVRNNKAKNISALQESSSVGLSAAIKVGPQLRLLAEVFGEDLLSFSADAGLQGRGAVYKRSTGLVCMDAGITAYAELNAFENCLIDDWLEIAVKFTIWDEENSPLQLRGHWENLERVSECTYNNNGTIKGTVANAENRSQYIEGASIVVLDNGDLETVETTVYSDSNGAYTAIVPGGTHLVRISADGYIPFESFETVGESQVIYLETYLMVEGSADGNETGSVRGSITNAVTGVSIPSVKLTVRKGWNMTAGEVVSTGMTDDAGDYFFELPLGNYTIHMECEGYVSSHVNVAVTKSGYIKNAALTPDGSGGIELGDMRIILEWSDEPSDLDSHLWGPRVDGFDLYHIFYYDMYYEEDGITYAYLDRDDTDYEGPETTTIYNMTANGVYSFYVHDYTNLEEAESTVMANSGAKVRVYMGEELIAQYHVPTTGVGTVWHVFDFDAVTGIITGVNTFSHCSNPEEVGSPYIASGDGVEYLAEEVIGAKA